MSQLINVLGFDPSLRNWGIAVGKYNLFTKEIFVDKVDIIQPELPNSKQVRQNSLDIISATTLYNKAANYLQNCDFAFIEVPVGSQSSRAMASYGICVGIAGALNAIKPMIQLNPIEVKLASYGTKTATKAEMINWAVSKYPNINWPTRSKQIVASSAEHMADAIAAIHAGVVSTPFLQTLSFYKPNHANQS